MAKGHYTPVPEGVEKIVKEIRRDFSERHALRARAYAAGGLLSLSLSAEDSAAILQRFEERGISLKAPQDPFPIITPV